MSRSGLVPALPSDFNKSAYWESFFKKRTHAFEWYGTYYELCGLLHKYIKPSDQILVAGCGNSELSENMFDSGLRNTTNIDISSTVIDQMNARKGNREAMKYLEMDLTDLKFEDESFSVIVDKGTLDAVMSDDSTASHETTDKIFSEYCRVLKNGGRYICITLAQDFILKKVLGYFPSNGWLVRLHRVLMVSENSSPLPVFAFVMTKFPKLPKKILEICVDDSFAATRVDTEEKIQEFIESQQQYAALTSDLNRNIDPTKDHPPIKLYATKNPTHPRFTMYIVDKASSKSNNKFAVFIIPLGSETNRMFSSNEGRRKVASQTPFRRLLFVVLHPSHEYGPQDQLQIELNSTVMDFAPPGTLPTDNVPYLSTDTGNTDQNTVQFEGQSSFSGEYVVEDFVKESDIWYRRLVLKNRSIIMSEVRLKKALLSHGRKSGRSKQPPEQVPDHSYLTDGYARSILAGLVLRFNQDDVFKAMILGVGGGSMSAYILHNYKNCHLTAVEIDGDLVKVGQRWFGLPKGGDGSRFQLCITDGIQFIYEENEKERNDADKYDVMIMDIGGQDCCHGIAFPTVESAELSFMRAASKILKKNGLLILNLLCWDDVMRSKVMYNFRKTFKLVGRTKCEEHHNEVLFCFNEKPNFSLTNSTKSSRRRKKKKQAMGGEKGNSPDINPVSSPLPDSESANDETNHLQDKISNGLSLAPPSGPNELNCPSPDNDATKNLANHEGLSILSEKFTPPLSKKATCLDKYDSNWFMHWKGKAGAWGGGKLQLAPIIETVVIEREVDYYEPR